MIELEKQCRQNDFYDFDSGMVKKRLTFEFFMLYYNVVSKTASFNIF
jgi:hypothetical protein